MGILDNIFGKKEKPPADFSDVKSGASSTAPSPTPPKPPPPPPAERTYVVVPGDSLSKIAKSFYGDANQWRRIYDANRDIIKNPDLIHPGQKLKIPNA